MHRSYGMWTELRNSGVLDVFLSTCFKILNNFQKNVENANIWNIPFYILHAIIFLSTLTTHSQSFIYIYISCINVEIKKDRFANVSSASFCTSQRTQNVRMSSCKALFIYVQVWIKAECFERHQEESQIYNFMKIQLVGLVLFHAHRWAEEHDAANSCFSQLLCRSA